MEYNIEDIACGPDRQRWKTTLKKNADTLKTILFAGNYEKITENGVTQELYYIGDKVIYVKQAGQPDKMYYVIKDHLGSVVRIVNSSGTAVFAAEYDVWGRQTVTTSTFAFHRGFTGHEHLPEFGLINMNGRMYDPVLGRFLSPDTFVQMADFSQSYNRYSYCLNNPLIYTDPDGEWFGIDDLLIAGVGFVFNYVGYGISTGDWGWKAVGAGGMGAVSAWLGYNTAGLSTVTWAPGQGITSATWNFAGSMAINTVANQIIPSMPIPISNNFSISVSLAFGLGTDGLSGGFNMTGTYTNGDFSISAGIGAGDNYWGWNAAAMDIRTGYGGGYGKTYYGGADVMGHSFKPQTVGNFTAYFNHNSFSFQDDFNWKGIGGDGKDRQRTFAAELTISNFSLGSYIYTNDGNAESKMIDPKNPTYTANDGHKAWKNGRVYFAPLWVGYRNGNQVTRIGLSRQWVQKVFQNGTHKLLFNL